MSKYVTGPAKTTHPDSWSYGTIECRAGQVHRRRVVGKLRCSFAIAVLDPVYSESLQKAGRGEEEER